MKTAWVLLLAALIASPAQAQRKALPPNVVRALAKIPSGGGSVLDRLKACRFKTDGEFSWLEVQPIDQPNIKAMAGEASLAISFDIPPPLGADMQPAAYTQLYAGWVISKTGIARPVSGWAKRLQNDPKPLGSISYLNC